MNPPECEQFRQIILKRAKRMAIQYVSQEVVDSMQCDVSSMASFFTDELVYRLTADFWEEFNKQKVYYATLEVPANWWEHFKSDHMPLWFLRRWPVKFTCLQQEIVYEEYNVYPRATIPLLGPPVKRLVVYENGGWFVKDDNTPSTTEV